MIDITSKDITEREAIAEGTVFIKPEVIKAIKAKKIPKGDVLEATKLAGILAAKKTPELIPLCHPIPIEFVGLNLKLNRDKIVIRTTVRAKAKTGVEMDALTATAIACLTIYDMCKPICKDITISGIKLLKKTGGRSGTYIRNLKFKNQNSK
ncbi:MAG: cyclic pyranopterin monophosphate synthase MoaC [Candidatus Omnitrophota bacterium]